MKKQNSDGSITTLYNGLDIYRSFIEKITPYHVNYVVEDNPPSEHTNISLGSRILIKDGRGLTAVSGTVIAKETVNDRPRAMLTARFDVDSSDIVIEERHVLLLPYQLDQHGKYKSRGIPNPDHNYCLVRCMDLLSKGE